MGQITSVARVAEQGSRALISVLGESSGDEEESEHAQVEEHNLE
jgi:hypothetical protein